MCCVENNDQVSAEGAIDAAAGQSSEDAQGTPVVGTEKHGLAQQLHSQHSVLWNPHPRWKVSEMKNGGGFTTVAILMSVLTSDTVSRAERMRQGRLKVTEVVSANT